MAEKGVTRMNISVTRDLKARMDALKAPPNWSAIAAQAFQAKLLELASKKETTSMKDVIERLQAAKELDANNDYQAGLKAGREWAEKEASPKQLQRVTDYVESSDQDGFNWWDSEAAWLAPFGAADNFALAALGVGRDDRDAPAEFWEQVLGDDACLIKDDDFFHGFGDGAAEVWNEVKGQV